MRDGHGDLRLEHVFFRPDGDFEVIDGIEFGARYRSADVCADVAFFAMDLERLRRVDLAERFLATYARAANDYDLCRLTVVSTWWARAPDFARDTSLTTLGRAATLDGRARPPVLPPVDPT